MHKIGPLFRQSVTTLSDFHSVGVFGPSTKSVARLWGVIYFLVWHDQQFCSSVFFSSSNPTYASSELCEFICDTASSACAAGSLCCRVSWKKLKCGGSLKDLKCGGSLKDENTTRWKVQHPPTVRKRIYLDMLQLLQGTLEGSKTYLRHLQHF